MTQLTAIPQIRAVETLDDHAVSLFAFLLEMLGSDKEKQQRCALVTIVGFSGPSSRRLGAHMVVCETGDYVGSVSSGCFDQNVALMALECLQNDQPLYVQLGEGSDFMDMKLPCGGGVKLLIQPNPDQSIVQKILHNLENRMPVYIALKDQKIRWVKKTETMFVENKKQTGWHEDEFIIHYMPKIKLIIAGRGTDLVSCVKIAMASGFQVIAHSPDKDDLDKCYAYGAQTHLLQAIDDGYVLTGDHWSAFLLLFHEHEWEAALLKSALQSDMFYIGALGSHATHLNRMELLKSQNIDEKDVSRIYGPIGLIPSMRNPSFLAISTLAQIISVYHKKRHVG